MLLVTFSTRSFPVAVLNTYNGNGAQIGKHTVADADYAEFVQRLERDLDVARIIVYRNGQRVAVIPCR